MRNAEKLLHELLPLSDRQISKHFMFLGEGIARKVYAINDNYVMKVSKGIDGYFQNNVENYVYNTVEEDLLKYLCPILAFNSRILIMQRAMPLSKKLLTKRINLNSVRKEKNALDDLTYLTRKYYLYYNDILSVSSWGQINNVNILIDYGCTNEVGDYYYGNLFKM